MEWVKVVGYIASILVASTSLLSASENVPAWWFHFSLIFLMGLVFSVPCVIFTKPISKRIKRYRLGKKQNTIAQRHFSRFEDLVYTAKRFNSPLMRVKDSLRTHYENKIQSSLAMDALRSNIESEIRNKFFEIEEMLKESNKTFRDLYLIVKQFELCLYIYKGQLKIIEEFAHEMMVQTNKPIAKGIEAEYEAFREKFNDFVKDFKDYCRIANKELGEQKFPEWAIDRIKKGKEIRKSYSQIK